MLLVELHDIFESVDLGVVDACEVIVDEALESRV